MGMYSMIEDAANKRLEELIASGMSEDDARDQMIDELDAEHDRFDGPCDTQSLSQGEAK